MIADFHKVSGALLAGLPKCAAPSGDTGAKHATSLPPEPAMESQTADTVSALEFSRMLDWHSSIYGIEKFGLHAANSFPLGASGAFGLGVMNAPTLGAAIEFFHLYVSLVVDHVSFVAEFGVNSLMINWEFSPFLLDSMNFVDFTLLVALRHFRRFAGPLWSPRVIQLKRPKSIDAKPYREAFSSHVEFGASTNQAEIASPALALKPPAANMQIFKQMKKFCETEIDERKRAEPLESKLNRVLLEGLAHGEQPLERIAAKVGMNTRTLQRRLASNGQSFEDMASAARKEYSSHLLQYTDYTIDEISLKLGYSGLNTYSRAATLWYGVPPSRQRARMRSLEGTNARASAQFS